MDFMPNLAFGFTAVATEANLLACALGSLFGIIVGSLRGTSPAAATALVLPLTFGLRPLTAVLVIISAAFGAVCGRATAASPFDVPPQNELGSELDFRRIAMMSAAAAGLAIIFVIGSAPVIAGLALMFGPSEFALLEIIVLVAAATLSSGPILTSCALVITGLLLSLVGADIETGRDRMTFGRVELSDGIAFVAIAIGLFPVADIIGILAHPSAREPQDSGANDRPARGILGATVLGILHGLFPIDGAGLTTMAGNRGGNSAPDSLDPTAQEGDERVSSATAAGGARLSASLLPLLSLGIPTNALAAVLIGGIVIQGVVPGPQIAGQHPDIYWGLLAGILVVQLLIVGIVMTTAGALRGLSHVDQRALAPLSLAYCCLAVYLVDNSAFEVFVMMGFGAFGYVLARSACDRGLLVIAFVMGPLLEENIKRAMLIARGDLARAIDRPLVIAMISVAVPLIFILRLWQQRRAAS